MKKIAQEVSAGIKTLSWVSACAVFAIVMVMQSQVPDWCDASQINADAKCVTSR